METSKHLSSDPERTFAEPRLLVENDDLTPEEKLALLKSWHADLIELQHATEENMAGANVAPGENAAKLAKVIEAIAFVEKQIGNRE